MFLQNGTNEKLYYTTPIEGELHDDKSSPDKEIGHVNSRDEAEMDKLFANIQQEHERKSAHTTRYGTNTSNILKIQKTETNIKQDVSFPEIGSKFCGDLINSNKSTNRRKDSS